MEQLTNDQPPKKRRRVVSSSPIVTEHNTNIESSPGTPEQTSPHTQTDNLDSNKVSHHGNVRNKSKKPNYGCLSGFLVILLWLLIASTYHSDSSSKYSSTYRTNKEYRDTVDETARVYDMSSEEVDASIQRILREINK